MESVLHIYHPKRGLLLLEYAKTTPDHPITNEPSSPNPQNVLLFVGGLYDTFRNPAYLDDLAALFPCNVPEQKWRVMQVQLSSHGRSFGIFGLDRDVEEMSIAINYIRDTITKSSNSPVVLMGFSTGCQDLMHYLVSPTSSETPRPSISGIILQAPVSDREAILHEVSTKPSVKTAYEAVLSLASSTPKDKHKTTILPMDISNQILPTAPINITRFLSLVSPDSPESPSTEDYYSSDLFDDRLNDTFGKIGSVAHLLPTPSSNTKSILILQGAVDPSIPASIDKPAVISRWKSFIEKGKATLDSNSQIIPHANHDISGSSLEVREARLVVMRGALLHYLDVVVGGVGESAHRVWERDMNHLKEERYTQKLKDKTGEDAKL